MYRMRPISIEDRKQEQRHARNKPSHQSQRRNDLLPPRVFKSIHVFAAARVVHRENGAQERYRRDRASGYEQRFQMECPDV